MARLENVIVAERHTGKGTEESPLRKITEIFTTDGKRIAIKDSLGGFNMEAMTDFALYCHDNLNTMTPIEAFKKWHKMRECQPQGIRDY